jgi:glycosyltransferase involved in cell wall biosynthesis
MTRLRVLISSYACEPGKGSEPGVGWKMPVAMSRLSEVWVITRSNNRAAIEQELARRPIPGLHFRYVDLPGWARWWKRRQRGIQIYYYLWQIAAYLAARRLVREIDVDVVQHLTFVKYWTPSFMAFLPPPFVWGPVGGAESAPKTFLRDIGLRGRVYEAMRSAARVAGEHDPFVRLTARRSALALATTEDTAARLRWLGAPDVRVYSESGASELELQELGRHAANEGQPARFMSIGRLLHWKGFHLGVRAFARAGIPDSEYWIAGDGPERDALQALAERLNVADRVRFFGQLDRESAFLRLAECAALVHPSLHDSGGMVCLEAMACARPVICLDLGGPGVQVTRETGFKISANDPASAVDGMAAAMRTLAHDPEARLRMGAAGRRRVEEHFRWEQKAGRIHLFFEEVLPGRGQHRTEPERPARGGWDEHETRP